MQIKIRQPKTSLETDEIKLKHDSMEKSFSLLDSTTEESSNQNTNNLVKYVPKHGKDNLRNSSEKNNAEKAIENNTKLVTPFIGNSKETNVECNIDSVSADITLI